MPSKRYIKNIKRAGSAFIGKDFCHQLIHHLNEALIGTDLAVDVRPEPLPKDIPDKDPRCVYVFYPSLFIGRHTDHNTGVVKINGSFLAAARQTV